MHARAHTRTSHHQFTAPQRYMRTPILDKTQGVVVVVSILGAAAKGRKLRAVFIITKTARARACSGSARKKLAPRAAPRRHQTNKHGPVLIGGLLQEERKGVDCVCRRRRRSSSSKTLLGGARRAAVWVGGEQSARSAPRKGEQEAVSTTGRARAHAVGGAARLAEEGEQKRAAAV